MKNLQFLPDLAQTFGDWPHRGWVNLWKFEYDWTKTMDLSLIALKAEISHWGAQVCTSWFWHILLHIFSHCCPFTFFSWRYQQSRKHNDYNCCWARWATKPFRHFEWSWLYWKPLCEASCWWCLWLGAISKWSAGWSYSRTTKVFNIYLSSWSIQKQIDIVIVNFTALGTFQRLLLNLNLPFLPGREWEVMEKMLWLVVWKKLYLAWNQWVLESELFLSTVHDEFCLVEWKFLLSDKWYQLLLHYIICHNYSLMTTFE